MSQDIRASRKTRAQLFAEIGEAARIAQNATDAMDEAVAELLGVNRTDAMCLDIVDRLGTVSAGRLAQESRLTTGAVTAVLDRLEAAGHVRRLADPNDRRRVLVEITEEARRLGHEAYAPIAQAGSEQARRFTREQLEGILEFLRIAPEITLRRADEIRAQVRATRGQGRTGPRRS